MPLRVLRRTAEHYLEVFVANDTEPSFLFGIDGRGEFEEIVLRAGAAYRDGGGSISRMGADYRD